ncbi:unnamed protein product, partial [Rotaria magnacalcarata]
IQLPVRQQALQQQKQPLLRPAATPQQPRQLPHKIQLQKKSFSSVFHCIGIVLFSYLIVHHVYQTFSTNVRSIHQSSDIAFAVKYHHICVDDSKLSLRLLSSVMFRSYITNYLGFVLRSRSLFYCSVPKVATRTFLTFITYLHIRDDLIPLLTNKSTLSNWNSQRKANPFDFNNINQILSYPMKVKIITRNFSHPFETLIGVHTFFILFACALLQNVKE